MPVVVKASFRLNWHNCDIYSLDLLDSGRRCRGLEGGLELEVLVRQNSKRTVVEFIVVCQQSNVTLNA